LVESRNSSVPEKGRAGTSRTVDGQTWLPLKREWAVWLLPNRRQGPASKRAYCIRTVTLLVRWPLIPERRMRIRPFPSYSVTKTAAGCPGAAILGPGKSYQTSAGDYRGRSPTCRLPCHHKRADRNDRADSALADLGAWQAPDSESQKDSR
jgi:hypothetical protein